MIVIYEEDGKTVFATGLKGKEEMKQYRMNKRYPDRKRRVRNNIGERGLSENKVAIVGRNNYRLKTKLQQQKKNAKGREYYHNVVVPRRMGLDPYRELGKAGRPNPDKAEPIKFHGKSKVSFD